MFDLLNPRLPVVLVGLATLSLGCVPGEEPEPVPTIIVLDDEEEMNHPPVCGDGLVEKDEVCDDGVNDGMSGSCLADCSAEGTSTCGNGVLDPGEHCDGTQGMVSCAALGFDGGGTAPCSPSCTLEVSTCEGVRRMPSVQGWPRGASGDNRFAIYEDIQLDCEGSTCYADPGEPGAVQMLDLIGGDIVDHGTELSTISLTPIDDARFWIIANWDRERHVGQLQIRRFDNLAEPVVVANDVSIELFDRSHPTHLSFIDDTGKAWAVPHGGTELKAVFTPERWVTSLALGPDGTTALVDSDDVVHWVDLANDRRVGFDGSVHATSPDYRWAVISSTTQSRVISMADGSVVTTLTRRLEAAEFSRSSNYLYVREEACSFDDRARVISLPDGKETMFGECGTYRSHGLRSFTDDDRWLMQSRWLQDAERNELLFTDLTTRETIVIPYRFIIDDELPVFAYEPTSEQVIFSGMHNDGTGPRAHRLELRTGEIHGLPDRFSSASTQAGGWLVSLRLEDAYTWDRHFMEPDGSMDLIARRTDWIQPIDTVPGLYLIEREAPSDGMWYARRGSAAQEQLSEETGFSTELYGDFLVWRDFDGTWLTIPK